MERKRRIIDVHAHVIPGVDDGARNMEEAISMLCMAARQGIRSVIATPHYSRRKFIPGLEDLAKQLQQEIREYYSDFVIYPGQETYYHDGLTENLREGKAYTLAGSRYILVEFDEDVLYDEMLRGIRAMMGIGYIPVLAHMERYPCLRKKGLMEEISRNGCIFQMNYESLESRGLKYKREVDWCRRQVRSGWIQLLGTDMHRQDERTPNIKEALCWLEQHVEEELLEAMTYRNPLHIINDEGID